MKSGIIKQVGRYIVGQAIGEGSFGKVYKGTDQFDKSEVALKFISKRGKNKKELEGLRAQNDMLKKICHKNIIKLLDFVQTQNQMIIITEFAGQNLSDVLEKKKKFVYDEVRSYCKQIFEALCYLDQNRIAHRDLKPQNILIQNQVIKICDFGFARKLSASTNFMNSLKGTPLYIAPQILATGPLNYTKKVDVWSFGIIIFELFVGRPPFYAQNLVKLKPKILNDKVKFPKQMPIELRTLINRMLQKNPQNRANWQQLKKFQFFTDLQPLTEKQSNIQKVQLQKQQYLKVTQQKPQKQQEQKEYLTEKKIKLNKLVSIADIQQIQKIKMDLSSSKIDGKKLRTDANFYEKAIQIYTSYFNNQGIVTKQAISYITSIFIHLIKRVSHTQIDSTQDIIRKKQLLFFALKLAQQDNQPQTIASELLMIGFLIKNNFDNISIDFQTDQDILQICLRQIQAYRNHDCFDKALTVLGILANQGIVTITNSEQFFIKIEKQQVLSIIADTYQPIPGKKIVLECLQKFIHPSLVSMITKNQHQLKKVFFSMKKQVANTLFKKNFLNYNPLNIYKDCESYAKILYQCLNISQTFRKEFVKYNYWIQFLQVKNLRVYCIAYDFICTQKDKIPLLSNQIFKIAIDNMNKIIQKLFYLARAQFYIANSKKHANQLQTSRLQLINQMCQISSLEQEAKKKACRQLEGFLTIGPRIIQQIIGQVFCKILDDPIFDRSELCENKVVKIFENILNFKPEEELRVSPLTAAKFIIAFDQLLKFQNLKLRQNKKIINIVNGLITFFLQNRLIFQLQIQQGPLFLKKLLNSIFSFIKIYSGVDQKQQNELYAQLQQKGIHNLLVADNIIDKQTLYNCLTIMQKLYSEPKYTSAIIDFIGITLMDKLKNFLKLDLQQKDSQVVVQILATLSLVIKKSEQYASKFKQIQIIQHFPRYIKHPTNQNLRYQTLNLIGNMSKHSPYFFQQFANHGVFASVVESVKCYGHGSTGKILKGIIYAMGNVSFYSQKFYKDFIQLIPILYIALTIEDQNITNVMSTTSNLLRHSNCFLKALVQNKIIKRVIQMIIQSTKLSDNRLTFGLNMIKKVLVYPEIFQDIPKSQFIAIYTQKVKIVGEQNDCMRKIRTLL